MSVILLQSTITVKNGTILRAVGQTATDAASNIGVRGGEYIGTVKRILPAGYEIQISSELISVPSGSNVFYDRIGGGFPATTADSAIVPNQVTISADGGAEYYIGEGVESISSVTVGGVTVLSTAVIGNDRNFIELIAPALSGDIVVTYVPENNKTIQITGITNAGVETGDQVFMLFRATTVNTHAADGTQVLSYPVELSYVGADAILITGANVRQIFL